MTVDRETYLDAIKLRSDTAASDRAANARKATTDVKQEARRAALSRSHEIRQFEIELYWKRANYFWLLQAAVFAAVALTWKNTGSGVPPVVPVVLSALGIVTASAGYLSALGSKFWQENWEHHIDMLEDEFEGRLHKTAFVGSMGVQWSVSGINERLGICFIGFWVLILLAATHTANPTWNLNFSELSLCSATLTEIATIIAWLGAIGGVFSLYSRPTKLTGDTVQYDDREPHKLAQKGWPRLRNRAVYKPFLVRREPHL
jgi:hypothetical protein